MTPVKGHAAWATLIERLAAATGAAADELAGLVQPPPKPEMGDYSLACFALAKKKGQAPPALAAELAAKLAQDELLTRVFEPPRAAGPYLNLRARPGQLCAAVLDRIRSEGPGYGRSAEGAGRTIVIDYSSPNLAKPFHVGHLMGTILGASLVRIFRFLSYQVVGVNHLGDWGTQCGYQIMAWQRADPARREEQLARRGLDYLADLYIAVNAPGKRVEELEAELARTPPGAPERTALQEQLARLRPEADALEHEARAVFRRLEEGDSELRGLWERLRRATLEVLQRSYDRLGVRFESDAGEAFYEPHLKPLVEELKQKGVLVESEGAWVIPLGAPGDRKKRPPFIVVKSDGATKYETRDLAAAIHRKRAYDFAQNLYVVDVRQSEYFQGLFSALRKCGCDWARDCHHVSYGIMKIKEGDEVLPMTTRGGRMIPLHELLDSMVRIVRDIVEQKNPDLAPAQKEPVAEAVGVGAVVFWVQSRRRDSHILFDWRQATNPDGDTGPYVQYTHARASSILRKFGAPLGAADLLLLREPEETAVARALERFPKAAAQAAASYEPSLISAWLLETARAFNDFYNKHQVLRAEPPLRDARLALVDCVRLALKQGLELIGVAAPEEM
jgi:arginyl-tRNA synthetase